MTSSVRLAAEESRNIQLIFLAVVMHRCRPAMGVKTLRCRAAGVQLIDQKPRVGAEGKRIAFLHPRSTGGVLVELSDH